jgi:HKD family nuclease
MDKIIQIFNSSLQTGYVDKMFYLTQLINRVACQSKNPKVLSTILQELENCNQFYISVAFVTTSGVATIINKRITKSGNNRSNFSFTISEFYPT